MIIFYDKETGKIIGNIEGRIHDEHSDMWMGGDTADRLIINWKKNESGAYEPDLEDEEQKEIAKLIDKNSIIIYDYKVVESGDSKKLVKV